MVETGQQVQRGALMVNVDPRTARNTMAQTQAEFEVARATRQRPFAEATGR